MTAERTLVTVKPNGVERGPVVVAMLKGTGALAKVRRLGRATVPTEAGAGSIRGKLCPDSVIDGLTGNRALQNPVHASGSVAANEREVWVPPSARLTAG
jgi:nucleoside diphosphate kinase